MEKLIQQTAIPAPDDRMSTRMVKSAAHLPDGSFMGWQMYVPKIGPVDMQLFGRGDISITDMEWIAEKTALTSATECGLDVCTEYGDTLYQLIFPSVKEGASIGFSRSNQGLEDATRSLWPMSYFRQFAELVRALKITGGALRYVVARVENEEGEKYRDIVVRTWGNGSVSAEEYIGRPVKACLLLRIPSSPSLRLRTVLEEDISEMEIHCIGPMQVPDCKDIWENPLTKADILPNMAARVMLLEPILTEEQIEGIHSCRPRIKPIFVRHENPSGRRAIEIGKAIDTSGESHNITIGENDIKRHWQIIGQTGTGKSSLLAKTIINSIKKGYGLTFFDPHGSTIEQILKSLPVKYAPKVRVVHIGDEENPVPLSMWSSNDPDKEEKTINDLCQLFADIFDPHNYGYVGPRWERWFSTFAKASIALLGQNASFESIITLSRSREMMRALCSAINGSHPALARIINDEYAQNNGNDFQEFINWCVSKFQRVTAITQLRNTLGAGANALDFSRTIDTDMITLIDLASPAIGTHAARIIGTLILMQFWNAVLGRNERSRTHLLFIDEAHLFQTNPLPQMLAEGRKFGLGIVIAHQHCGQLNQEVLDALEANSANFTAFRLSARDAATAAIRLDNPMFSTYLCRLNEFCSITSLSANGRQTPPFSMGVERIHKGKCSVAVSAEVERRSRMELVEPYRSNRPLTYEDIMKILEGKKTQSQVRPEYPLMVSTPLVPTREQVPDVETPDWLTAWNERVLFDEENDMELESALFDEEDL